MRAALVRFLAGFGLTVLVWTGWTWLQVRTARNRQNDLDPYRRQA